MEWNKRRTTKEKKREDVLNLNANDEVLGGIGFTVFYSFVLYSYIYTHK